MPDEAYQLVPVDHDPFAGQDVSGVGFAPPMNSVSTPVTRFANSLVQPLLAPGRAYQSTPNNPIPTEQMIAPAVNLAGMVMGGGMPLASSVSRAGETSLGIVPVDIAKRLNVQSRLPTDDIFQSAVKNTPGARVEDNSLVMPVMRQQTPDQEMAESVRGGVFYQPQRPGAYSYTGKNNYGGSQSIVGETALKNPLFVKGATGGKAPEMAFDQINGKGAYQAMRSDALKTFGYNTPQNQKIANVQSFLEKYAPELSNHAEYIIQNSSQGNQLAYALQEAAVASAARNKGHDAILGYSVSRNTKEPFLSEMYDIRENRYPSPNGDYSVWPQFKAE